MKPWTRTHLLAATLALAGCHAPVLPDGGADAARDGATVGADADRFDAADGNVVDRDADPPARDAAVDAVDPRGNPVLGDYWVTNAYGQPRAKWHFDRLLSHTRGGTDYLGNSFNHIVIGPPDTGRCPPHVAPWWDIHGGGGTVDPRCDAAHRGWGTQVSLSCDQGQTWGPDVQAILPVEGQAWACFATDGRMFFDAATGLWHFLFQCMNDSDYAWNGCHLQTAGDPDRPGWVLGAGQTGNPVIHGGAGSWGSLWGQICQPGDKCGAERWVGEEGTFDISFKDSEGYFWVGFHGYGASTNLYRGLARTQDFVHYQVNGAGGTPTDSVFDVQTQRLPGNGVNETWPRYSAGGAATMVQDTDRGLYYMLVENIDNQSNLSDPNVTPGADVRWDLSLGRQTTLSANDWDYGSLPEGNPIFLSPFNPGGGSTSRYPQWLGASDCYPYLFFDPAARVWHLMACREHGGGADPINSSTTTLYSLVYTDNALPDGDFNTRPGPSGNGRWATLAAPGGTMNMVVYREPWRASDDQQFLETNSSTPSGSVYEDVPGMGALAGRPVRFGGKVRGAVGATGRVVVWQFDAASTVIGHFELPFTIAGTDWQPVDYAGAERFAASVATIRFQMYLDVAGQNYDFDEMYLNAP